MDYPLEQWINAPAGSHPLLDTVMVHAAAWGEAIFIGLIIVWFLVGWLRHRAADRQGAIAAAAGAGMALLVNVLISHLWTRPRPFVTHPAVHVLLRHSTDASFPSDHASPAFAIAAILFAVHRKLGTLALLFAVLMCYARVYVGDHYPGDVLAGAVIGGAVAWVLLKWCTRPLVFLRQLGDRILAVLPWPAPVTTSAGVRRPSS